MVIHISRLFHEVIIIIIDGLKGNPKWDIILHHGNIMLLNIIFHDREIMNIRKWNL